MGRCLPLIHIWEQVSGHCKGVNPEYLNSFTKGVPLLAGLRAICTRFLLQGLIRWADTLMSWCSVEHSCNVERKLWTLALLLALLDPQLYLFQDWVKGHGTMQPKECNSTQIRPFTTSHSPMWILEHSFPKDILRTLLPQGKEKFNCLVTLPCGEP